MVATAASIPAPEQVLLFKMDCAVRTGRNTQAIEIAFVVIDHGLPVDQGQGTVRANLDALSGTATFLQIDDDFHGHSLS
jgi:hypothetical protein